MDVLNVHHAVVLAAAATASDGADEQLIEAELQLEQATVQGFTVAGCASLFAELSWQGLVLTLLSLSLSTRSYSHSALAHVFVPAFTTQLSSAVHVVICWSGWTAGVKSISSSSGRNSDCT